MKNHNKFTDEKSQQTQIINKYIRRPNKPTNHNSTPSATQQTHKKTKNKIKEREEREWDRKGEEEKKKKEYRTGKRE